MSHVSSSEALICFCRRVTEDLIIAAIRKGARDLQSIRETTGACTGSQCRTLNPKGRCCSADIEKIIGQELKRKIQADCPCCGKE